MTKVIRRKGMVVVWGLILLVFIAYGIKDYSLLLGFIFFIIFFAFLFVRSIVWKLEYNEISFSVKNEGIDNLEYKKIESIVHYKSYRFKSRIDKFIISYMGKSEFGYEEELQKAVIKFYTHNTEMMEFFSFVHEKNPEIDFHVEDAGYDGVEKKEFDYFADKVII